MECFLVAHLDIPARLDLPSVSAILRNNLLLVWHILYPVDVLCAASTHLALYREWR
jgi:hypothetical protein